MMLASSSAHGVEVVLSCGATGVEYKDCQKTASLWEKKSGHTVKVVSAPSNVSERLVLYKMLLAARSADVDVFPLDVVWPGIIGNHFIDLPPFATPEFLAEHFPAYIANN